MKHLLILASMAAALAQLPPAPNWPGNWQGTLQAGPAKLRIGLHITRTPGGVYTSTLDSIDQGESGLPVATTRISGRLIHLDLPNLRASYEGELSEDGNTIEGDLTQGTDLPLTLHRVARVDTLRRPQQPRPPFPYDSEEVSYASGSLKLAGTLTRPRGAGPFPAVLLLTGSGPQDRDESTAGHKPFLVLADFLTRRGLAVLRVDDRGVGGSSGSLEDATLEDLAADALAGVQFLKTRKEIDAARIGLIGHSEGAIAASIAGARGPDTAFLVLLAGTGVPGEQVLYLQGETISRSAGASEQAISDARDLQQNMVKILREEPDEFVAIEKIRESWAVNRESLDPAVRAQVDAQIIQASTPQIRSFLFHDPAEDLRKVKAPVLALNGSRDMQVPPQQNLPAIAAALAENPDVTIASLPGLNHLFQKCQSCLVTEYSALEETISPQVLEMLSDWITRHTRK